MSLVPAFLNHYESYFGEAAGFQEFSVDDRKITIPRFDGVFQGCRVFCTLGLAAYREETGRFAELCLCADSLWDEIPSALATTAIFAIANRVRIGTGVLIEGITGELEAATGKSALYFTLPPGLPDQFADVLTPLGPGDVFGTYLVHEKEARFIEANGAPAWEELILRSGIDPFVMSRSRIL